MSMKWAALAVAAVVSFAVPAPVEAQSTFGKTQVVAANQLPTQGQLTAAAAQNRCVELLKEQPRFDKNLAVYTAKTKELEGRFKTLPQTVSTGGGSERCRVQEEQISALRGSYTEHIAYLDNLGDAIKLCALPMTDKLSSAQLAVKKSLDLIEKVVIATEGAYTANCKG